MQQNCTAAGKVTFKELSTYLLPNPGHTHEPLHVPPARRKQQCTGHGAEEQQPPGYSPCHMSATSKPAFALSFLTCIPHLVGPWTSQEDRSDLHPSMRHKWPTIFLFCLLLFYTLWLNKGRCKAPWSQALKVVAAGPHLQNGAALPSADIGDFTVKFIFFPHSSLHFLQLWLWGY